MCRSFPFTILTYLALCCIAQNSLGQKKGEPRLWKDASGKFQIRAALIEQTDKAVRLHTTDGREISVPIQRLSQDDQDYLKSLNASAEKSVERLMRARDAPFFSYLTLPPRIPKPEISKQVGRSILKDGRWQDL